MEKSKKRGYFNENYIADTEYAVRVAKILLTPIGIWPRYGNNKPVFYARVAVMIGLMLFLLTPHFIWTFFKAEDLRKLMKIIAAMVFSSLAIIKYVNMIINKADIRRCLEVMEKDYHEVETEEDRQIMIKNAKIGRFFTAAYLSISYGGALPYHIIMPLIQPRMPKSYGNDTIIPLPYPSEYVFFIVEDPPLYHIIFVTQILISSIILSTNTGVYSLIACMVMHCCCLFDVTSNKISNFLKDRKRLLDTDGKHMAPDLVKRLNEIIDFHVGAIRYKDKHRNTHLYV